MTTFCHCGRPLHYNSDRLQRLVEELVSSKGEYVRVPQLTSGRVFLVPRHYLALHGLKAEELHTLGFTEVTPETATA